MPAMIQCPTCQKEYRWQPELAGKRVKCTCGEPMDMPANPPISETEELYDLVDEPAPKQQHAISDLQGGMVASPVAVEQSTSFPCPYCGETIEAGSSMCVFCGSTMEGAPIPEYAKRTVPTAVQAAPPVTAKPVVMRAEPEEDRSAKIKLILLGVVALALVVGSVIFAKRFMPKPPARDPNLKAADIAIIERVEASGGEAREWLKGDETRTLSGMLHKQAVFKVDQLYEMGARKVMVIGRGEFLAIELPSETAKRKAIFDWQRKWATDYKFKIETDEGQKWIEVPMHL